MTQVNISDVIDRSRFGAFQWGILILCSLCVIMDGFDVQAMGYIAPALVRDWHIPNSALGPVFSAALTGVLVGSLLCSMLADRIGRRPVLILGALYFSAFTLLTARANSVGQLLAIRFIAGIGLGGMMPNAMALVGEYSPKKVRITALMVIGCGFTAGAAMGGFVAAWLIPAFGWLFRRRGSARDCRVHDRFPARIASVSGIAGKGPGEAFALARENRSFGERFHRVRGSGGKEIGAARYPSLP
jgi:AAHS family 4-hydroxybenzoate transporter-like MFS transporter